MRPGDDAFRKWCLAYHDKAGAMKLPWFSRLVRLSVIVLAASCICDTVLAASSAPARRPSGPSCGLLCVRGSFCVVGEKPPELGDLFLPRYIGSRLGSSSEELAAAVTDHGLHAFAFQNLTPRSLARLNRPVILHVSAAASARAYSHWILFCGAEGGKFRVIDFPDDPRMMTAGELAAIWDGNGIVISKEPVNPLGLQLSFLFWEVAPLLAAVGLALSLLASGASRYGGNAPMKAFFGFCGISIVVIALTSWRHVVRGDGFVQNDQSTNRVVQTFQPADAQRIRHRQDLHEILQKNPIIVDARLSRDYQAGHIEGAISIPVRSTRSALLSELPQSGKDRPVLVYCQSDRCPFAEQISRRISAEGFSNTIIYSGGWLDWQASQAER